MTIFAMSLNKQKNEGNTTNIESILPPDKQYWQSYRHTVLLLPDIPFGFPNANVHVNTV